MAKIEISLPDDLLRAIDAEAARRDMSRNALLQNAIRREVDLVRRRGDEVLAELDVLSETWSGPLDAAALVRAERQRGI